MVRYLLVVYGLGGAWLWWLALARGSARVWMGIGLVVLTIGVALAQRSRSRRLHSPWEWISSRAVTHGGRGTSQWNRDRSERPDDPDDLEAHVGGGF
jgi:hypothetical protein